MSSSGIAFVSTDYSYSLSSSAPKVSLSGTSHLGLSCTFAANGILTNFTPCTQFSEVVTVPNTVNITVYAEYDDDPKSEDYQFVISVATASAATTIAIAAASIGAVVLVAGLSLVFIDMPPFTQLSFHVSQRISVCPLTLLYVCPVSL